MPFDNIGTRSESATPQCVDDNCHSELIGASAASHVLVRSMPTLFVCMYVCHRLTDRSVVLRMRRNMLSTCCSCARPTNALHSPSISSIYLASPEQFTR